MKALMKKDSAPGAELVDIDIPEIGPKDVLVKVRLRLYVVLTFTSMIGLRMPRPESNHR